MYRGAAAWAPRMRAFATCARWCSVRSAARSAMTTASEPPSYASRASYADAWLPYPRPCCLHCPRPPKTLSTLVRSLCHTQFTRAHLFVKIKFVTYKTLLLKRKKAISISGVTSFECVLSVFLFLGNFYYFF